MKTDEKGCGVRGVEAKSWFAQRQAVRARPGKRSDMAVNGARPPTLECERECAPGTGLLSALTWDHQQEMLCRWTAAGDKDVGNKETEAVLLDLLGLGPLQPMLDPHISWADGSTKPRNPCDMQSLKAGEGNAK